MLWASGGGAFYDVTAVDPRWINAVCAPASEGLTASLLLMYVDEKQLLTLFEFFYI